METIAPSAIRWQPIEGIPESPCGDFHLESHETQALKLILRYRWIKGNDHDLRLIFCEVLAFRTFWDGDGDIKYADHALPRCVGFHAKFIWPLLQIDQSPWLANGSFAVSNFIAETTKQPPWTHYRILTLERSLDVLARGQITGEWVDGDNATSSA